MSKSRMRPLAPFVALDHAVKALSSNDPEQALRHAVPVLGDDSSRGAAADVIGRALVALDRKDHALDAFELAVKLLSRSNLVAHAVACALSARAIGAGDDLLKSVAQTFGAGGTFSEKTDARPPALNREELSPLDAALKGDRLVDRVAAALTGVAVPKGESSGRLKQPLWSALPEAAFVRFAQAMHVRILPGNSVMMKEGDAGDRAFIVVRGEVRVWRLDPENTDGDADNELELAILGPGAIVGEMALVTDAPRAATVVTTRASVVLEAPRAALDAAATEVPSVGQHVGAFCRRRLIDNVLRSSPILREAPVSEREGLAAMFVARPFDPGNVLIKQGKYGAGLHVIAIGSADVVRTEAGTDTSRLARLGPGSVAGEISLVLRKPATASVVAATSGVSLVLPPDRFAQVIKGRPHLLAQLYDMAIRREDETMSVVAQEAVEADDIVIV